MKITTFLLLVLVGCASRPKLYPNDHLRDVGKRVAEEDIDACIAEAEDYLESGKGKQVAKGAGAGAVVGAAVGAVSGLFTGNMGRSLLQGSAVGAGAGAAGAALTPDEIKRRYVNQCLADKGYRVLGWD